MSEEKVVMKGYKAFNKGMICRDKQYFENTVFEEDSAKICKSGMHFCKNPLDIFDYYPLINDKGEITEIAEVEALDEVLTDDKKKYCTKKLKIGAKISLAGFIKASLDVTRKSIIKETEEKETEAEETTKSGIVLPGQAQEKPQQAEVIAVGPGGVVNGKEVKMEVEVGNTVIYSKYAGTEVKMDGTDYIIVKQEDILAIIK